MEGNKLTDTLKRLSLKFNLYCKFMSTGKNIGKNKTNLPHPPFHSSHDFLNIWKTTKPMTVRFSDFQFIFIDSFVKN